MADFGGIEIKLFIKIINGGIEIKLFIIIIKYNHTTWSQPILLL